jgi:hypothetical protein
MNGEVRDTPVEQVRNSELLRAEYGIPSAKDEGWSTRSRSDDEHFDDRHLRRELERAIDPIDLARTEELIARARFFSRVRAAADTGGALMNTTAKRVLPFAFGCAAVMLGFSLLIFVALRRDESQVFDAV